MSFLSFFPLIPATTTASAAPVYHGGMIPCLGDVEPVNTQWLVKGYFPMGAVSVVAGPGGVGKGVFMADREKRKAKIIAKNGGEIIKTKTCPHCGKVFTPTSNRQLFCSRECWNQARLEQKKADREAERGTHYYRQRTCAVCGHAYWPTHSQQEFCSDECRKINHNRKTLEFYHKKKGNLKPDPEATPTPKPKEDNAA